MLIGGGGGARQVICGLEPAPVLCSSPIKVSNALCLGVMALVLKTKGLKNRFIRNSQIDKETLRCIVRALIL